MAAPKPTKIKPIDCVPTQEIANNIMANNKLITEWMYPCKVNTQDAWLLSAGPSLEFAVNTMFPKEWWEKLDRDSYKIFCIKHALPVLKKAGVVPDFCVALDPRPIKGTSTHGHVREGLYAEADRRTVMLIASMTHPSVTEYLIQRGHRVIGWHAASNAIQELIEQDKMEAVLSIGGGTSSAMRAFGLAHMMGFRKVKGIGFDCSLAGEPADKGALAEVDQPDGSIVTKPKYVHVVNPKDKDAIPFWTTGELIAQAQDVESFLKNNRVSDTEIRFYATDKGRSYGGNVIETTKNNTIFPTVDKRLAE